MKRKEKNKRMERQIAKINRKINGNGKIYGK